MELDKRAAFNALKAYARTLEPSPGAVLPAWLKEPAEPVLEYWKRGHHCWVFALKQPLGTVTGYVLDADGEVKVAHEVHDGNVQAALWLVGLGPGHGVAVPWRERNHR